MLFVMEVPVNNCRYTCMHYIHHSFYQYVLPNSLKATMENEGTWCRVLDPLPSLACLTQYKTKLWRELAKNAGPVKEEIIDVVGDDSFVAEPVDEFRSNLSVRRELYAKYCQNRNTQVKLLQKISYRDNSGGTTFEVTFPFIDNIEACADRNCCVCVPNYDQPDGFFDRIAAEHDEQKAVNVVEFQSNFGEDLLVKDELFEPTVVEKVEKKTTQKKSDAFICPTCSRVLSTKYSLRQHLMKVHEKTESFVGSSISAKKRGRPRKTYDYGTFVGSGNQDNSTSVDIKEKPILSHRKLSLVPPEAMIPVPIGLKYNNNEYRMLKGVTPTFKNEQASSSRALKHLY